MIGTTLSHYRILSKLGEGGMGEVYRAHDEKLDRDVAIKVLPEAVTQDAGRLARFETEAKAVAALNHPNIVTIFSVEKDDGVHFITMELVEGKTLSELIPRKGMPIAKLLGVAIPLANAVSTAHEQGIIHRDLKPDNLMVNDEGMVKILDFGLAKLRGEVEKSGIGELPTQSATQQGRIIGTAAYMSPEQAEGKTIDQRSDIFSLGIVLYEMATGLRPFTGDSTASTLSAILKDTPPPVTELNPALPPLLARIVRRCLVKDPERRYQNVKDLRNELEELKQEVDSGEALDRPQPHPAPVTWKWISVAAGAVAAVAVSYILLSGRDAREPITGEFTQLTTQTGREYFPSLSPDGGFVVYSSDVSGNWDIYFLRVGGAKAINLTENSPFYDSQPALSPDGSQIAFRSERQDGGIFIMGATGESVRRLTDEGNNPAWSPTGDEIVFTRGDRVITSPGGRFQKSELWVIEVSTGAQRLVTNMDAMQPSWSPSGNRIAYWNVPYDNETDDPESTRKSGQRDIWTIPASGGEPRAVTDDPWLDWNPVWSHDGRHLFFSSDRGGTMNLWRVPIDERSGEVLGDPKSLTTPTAWVGHMSASHDGRKVAFTSRIRTSDLYRIAFDSTTESVEGQPIPVFEDSRSILQPDLSPDDEMLVFLMSGTQEDIAVIDTSGGNLRKLTDDPHNDRVPRWSPDGSRITFYSNRSGSYQIWSINPDGSGLRQLTDSPFDVFYSSWSPDGEWVLSRSNRKDGGLVWFLWNPDKPWREQTPLWLPPMRLEDEGSKRIRTDRAEWSPDGRSIAATIGYPGGIVIYDLDSRDYRVVAKFEPNSPKLVSNLRWLKDSRRLLFSNDEGTISLLDTETGRQKEILSVDSAPKYFPCLSKDNEVIYFSRRHVEADIWMLTLDEER